MLSKKKSKIKTYVMEHRKNGPMAVWTAKINLLSVHLRGSFTFILCMMSRKVD